MSTDIDAFDSDRLRETYPEYDDQLIHQEDVPSKSPNTIPSSQVLPDSMSERFDNDLYTHQAAAIETLQRDENVTVATSTSSGKTWIYTLYFAMLKERNPDAKALFIYPTKALSSDQEYAVNNLLDDVGSDAVAETYDGDTKDDRKPVIRNRKDIIISNFAGINYYLSDHTKWGEFYSNVELVVIDESHSYTGVQGMHVCWIIRRLHRILNHYDSDPQLVCSTATIGNPKEHSESLTGEEFTVIDDDGSPRGRRDIAFWQPPIDDEEELLDEVEGDLSAARSSASSEAARVATHLGLSGVQTLNFIRSQQGTEITAKQAVDAAKDHPSNEWLSVDPYHAGLSKQRRQAIENKLKTGDTDAVFSTNALELGIDIGSVDATVLAGYPGTRQSFWQQIGRAGRGTSDALSVYIPREDAIDQYICDDPGYLLEDDVEDAVVSLENNAVYARHVLCASEELPITEADVGLLGDRDRLERAIGVWNDAGKLRGELETAAQYAGPPRPQSTINLYSTSDIQYDIRCRTEGHEIDAEPIQKERAYRDYHPGSLVMHDGIQYEVIDIHEDRRQPYVEVDKTWVPEYTVTSSEKTIQDITKQKSVDLGDGYAIHAGMGTVKIHYTEYRRLPIYGRGEASPPIPIDLPPISLRTQLMWIELPTNALETVMSGIPKQDHIPLSDEQIELGVDSERYTFAGGLHGAEHGMIKISPLELRLDNSDMGGLAIPRHSETQCPTWFIHDSVEGGVGFSHSIYENFASVAEKTLERVSNCDCGGVTGCPSCLMSSQCGNNNEPLHTIATTTILDEILSRVSD